MPGVLGPLGSPGFVTLESLLHGVKRKTVELAAAVALERALVRPCTVLVDSRSPFATAFLERATQHAVVYLRGAR